MLDLHDVTRRFGALTAVDHVTFGASAGEMVGLLGPNGAGKTTTVAMIAGLLPPDSGEVRIGGRRLGGDTDPLKSRIGLVTQDLALIDDLSAARLARDIVRKIEESLTYPGQIKVTVIRETRSIEYAK